MRHKNQKAAKHKPAMEAEANWTMLFCSCLNLRQEREECLALHKYVLNLN